MILATTTFDDFDTFLEAFKTVGLEKRREYGSGGSHVFRDPSDPKRAWVVFDWDMEGYEKLLSDPDMPGIFEKAGLQGPPQKAEPAGDYEA